MANPNRNKSSVEVSSEIKSSICNAVILPDELPASGAEHLTPHMTIHPGPVNGVVLESNERRLAVYGLPEDVRDQIDLVLLTHHRRDVLWAAREVVAAGATAVGPDAERQLIERPAEFWNDFSERRFHDYDQQSTKILSRPLKVDRWVKQGDVVRWEELDFHVLDTPGYTRGSVSYLSTIDSQTVAFTGDLIYAGGRIIDLYSFQDAISKATILGYHGYGSRLAMLRSSLRMIADQKPDLLVPARGPVIRDPQAAIGTLIERIGSLYRNYQSTNALYWYFKEDRLQTCADRILGEGSEIQLMPYCLRQDTPDWIWQKDTSRLLISDEGRGFLLDCGTPQLIVDLKSLLQRGIISGIDGIFVTHYHDDHTDQIQAAAEAFDCPVYALKEYEDILKQPDAYRMPAMTVNPIHEVKGVANGQTMRWQEFELTFHFFPGQAYYHGALWVRKENARPVLFIGDSFSPSGMDDYCVLNRNLTHEDSGYLLCFRKMKAIKDDYWLINQHIEHVFAFTAEELDGLEHRYRDRIAMLREIFPWDDPNYGIDEQWAVFYPYGVKTKGGQTVDLELRLINHSPVKRTFSVKGRVDPPMKFLEHGADIRLGPRANGTVCMRIQAPSEAGHYLVTADIGSGSMQFRQWAEALITVE